MAVTFLCGSVVGVTAQAATARPSPDSAPDSASHSAPQSTAPARPAPTAAPVPATPIPEALTSTGLTATLEAIVATKGVPALAAILLKDGAVIAEAAAGVRCAGCDVPVTTSDLWHVGSITKSMTSTLVAVLVAEGVLSWDLTLEQAFPAWAATMRPEYRAATLRDLLTMRARIPGQAPSAAWQEAWAARGTPTEQRRRFGAAVLADSAPVQPEAHHYSNQAYALAGLLCEEATGTPFETLLLERVARPLGITTLGFGAPATPTPPPTPPPTPAPTPAPAAVAPCAPTQPCGHRTTSEPMPPGPGSDNPPALSPAGRAHLTLRDWTRFAAAHLDGERGGSPALRLDAASFLALHAPAPGPGTPYACGWVVGTDPRFGPTLWHNGSNTMWYAEEWLAPDARLAVMVACNQGGPAAEDAVRAALRAVRDALAAPAAPGPADR